ncbi:MAG: L-2-hydroxyglutarate oxidase [Armatimonadetes bacterium]|nr:L-2-hydroxyglutarate oxidase [Armatimonadota bacterium]
MRLLIVGAGLVGAAAAHEAQRLIPGLEVVVIDKNQPGDPNQSTRNSGVIHQAPYYKPGSLKARYCLEGQTMLREFAAEENIPIRECGKLIVAVGRDELPRLDELERRGRANGTELERIPPEQAREREPYLAPCAGALFVKKTAVISFPAVLEALLRRVRERGGQVVHRARLLSCREDGTVETTRGEWKTDFVVACAGLHGVGVARILGFQPRSMILPFRGEYMHLAPEANHLVRGLIYPVPDPAFPFLGNHATIGPDGAAHFGPTAVPATALEGWRGYNVSPAYLLEALRFPGTWRLFGRQFRMGLSEIWRSLYFPAFLKSCQGLIPEVRAEWLHPAPELYGVRAQLVNRRGEPEMDFVIEERPSRLAVLNAPSPAATASRRIGLHIASLVQERLGLAQAH